MYLIIESYYYGDETACFNNLEESEKMNDRSFYEWLITYDTLATFKWKHMEEKDSKKAGKVKHFCRNEIIKLFKKIKIK